MGVLDVYCGSKCVTSALLCVSVRTCSSEYACVVIRWLTSIWGVVFLKTFCCVRSPYDIFRLSGPIAVGCTGGRRVLCSVAEGRREFVVRREEHADMVPGARQAVRAGLGEADSRCVAILVASVARSSKNQRHMQWRSDAVVHCSDLLLSGGVIAIVIIRRCTARADKRDAEVVR